jgi:hypothetical protein
MNRRVRLSLFGLLLGAALLACNAVGVQPPAPPQVLEPSGTPVPSATGVPETVAVVTPEMSPTVPIVHLVTPGDPLLAARFMTDRSSAILAGERRSIADDFNNGQFERPYTSQVMDYKGYLDLTRGEISASGVWLYVVLFLEGSPTAGEPAAYGVEIDLDLDGRGDWMIVGAAPTSSSWTTDGVRAFTDTNNDVGAQTPLRSDPPGSTTGFDSLVFDQGQGPDPDAAWIRLSPVNPNQIQIAFKTGLIGGSNHFLWGVWSFADPQPAWQDYNDHLTLEQAGSPLIENSNYPVKELALSANTCRWGYDFNPTGSEPGVCRVPTPTATPSKTPTPTPTEIIIY